MAQIAKIKLPPLGRLKLETGENIAFLSGDVPRLVLISGSDACDIYEGQSLPSNANSPYLQNPYSFPVSAVVGYGMMESAFYVQPIIEGARFYEKAFSTMSTAAAVASHATLRSGYGFMTRQGKAEVQFTSNSPGARARIAILNDASPDFIAAKPAGFMDNATAMYNYRGEINQNLIALSGNFADADITAWMGSAGYAGRVGVYHVDSVESPLRLMIDAKTAVFISRDPALSNAGRATVREIGKSAEEFT